MDKANNEQKRSYLEKGGDLVIAQQLKWLSESANGCTDNVGGG